MTYLGVYVYQIDQETQSSNRSNQGGSSQRALRVFHVLRRVRGE